MLVAALAMLVPLGPARQCVLRPQHQARAAPRCAAPPSAPRERRTKKRLRAGAGGAKATPKDVAREKHLFFDEVTLSVRGGQGGHGAAFDLPKAGKGAKLARTADGDFALPEGGGRGGSVVLEVDTALQDLLHLHGRPLVAAPRGADSAGLNQYRKVQRQQREASFLSHVDLDCISPTSPLHLPCISPTSPIYLPYISPTSPRHLPGELPLQRRPGRARRRAAARRAARQGADEP